MQSMLVWFSRTFLPSPEHDADTAVHVLMKTAIAQVVVAGEGHCWSYSREDVPVVSEKGTKQCEERKRLECTDTNKSWRDAARER